jgi:hypothetical protein
MTQRTRWLIVVLPVAVAVLLLVGVLSMSGPAGEVRSGGAPAEAEPDPPETTTSSTLDPETIQQAARYAGAVELALASPPPVPVSCASFGSQGEAQAWLDEHGAGWDVSAIDSDGDGKPCTAVCYSGCEPPPTVRPGSSSASRPAETAPKGPGPTASAGGSVWDQIAQCESGQNWATNTGNGYSGGLQFLHSTWNSYGGAEFAPMAYQATRNQQIVVAERIRASQGGTYRAWPGCRAKLGLP